MTANVSEVAFGGDENTVKLNTGDGHTTLWIYLKPWNGTGYFFSIKRNILGYVIEL